MTKYSPGGISVPAGNVQTTVPGASPWANLQFVRTTFAVVLGFQISIQGANAPVSSVMPVVLIG
jgi:hypothetical protein